MRNHSYGQSLIELLLAISLLAILLPALLTGLLTTQGGKPQQSQRIEAIALMKEAEEVVRSVREKDWASFAVNGDFHPTISNNSWVLTNGNETINGLTRTLMVSDVYRDANGVIVENGGTLDPSTKKVAISITWNTPYPSSATSAVYATRYVNNNVNEQSSQAQFLTGNLTDTQVTNNSGGEIALAPNTKGKWCTPSFSSTTISLPDGPPVAVAAMANADLNIPNDIFVATSPNTANPVKLAHTTIPVNIDPPAPNLRGIFTLDPTQYSATGLVPAGIGLDNNFKTNKVKYYTSTSGKTYALLATTNPDREVIAVLVNDGNGANDNTNDGEYQDYVNKIYKYWTFFNTVIYNGAASLYDSGYQNPTANTADSGGDGDGYGSNPTRAYTSDGSYAVDTNSGNNTGTSCTGADKDKHRFYNYNFTVPADTTVSGLEVRLDARADSTSGSPKICVQLSWDGGTSWTSAKSTSQLTTNNSSYILGNSGDNWGHPWTETELNNNANFRVRMIDVASSTSRDFSLDWVGVRIYGTGGVSSTSDQAPYGYGASSLAVLGNTGYVTSGGFLYAFDLSNIDNKSTNSGLDMIGCRMELDGYDCNTATSRIKKYDPGDTGNTYGTEQNWLSGCNDGGNVELYATNDIFPIQVGSNTYVYVAVGGATNPEFEIINVSSIPTSDSTPQISDNACGTIASGNSGWHKISGLDFNSLSNTQEAANSVAANADGTRAYVSSNGGIDANNDGKPDSWQFYIINTSNKNSPTFLSGTSSTGATSGYYYGTGTNAQLYPRRAITVFSGSRALLAGQDGVTDANNAQEYQVVDISNETVPSGCGGIDYSQGFNDMAEITEADNDKFVYMVSSSGANQLKIIQGGPDGSYLDFGTYESSTMDIGKEVAFNRLITTTTLPANAIITYQVATAHTVSGSCSGVTFNYVGPDGTANSFFASSGGAIPLLDSGSYANPGQCVRYKAYLSTTDFNVTPQLLDVSVNYSQ